MTAGSMHYFQMLSNQEQQSAIRRMSNSGLSDYTIAAATKLSVEMIRQILGRPAEPVK